MSTQQFNFDEIKAKLDGAYEGKKVSAVIDYDKTSFIVCYDVGDIIPGAMFRVNKKTGAAEPFVFSMDPKGFTEAADKRSKVYK